VTEAGHIGPKRSLVVLVVEDDPGDQLLIGEAFEVFRDPDGAGRDLVMLEDGEQALDYLRRRDPYAGAVRPDWILLDLNLPKYDGRQVLAEIKSDQALRTIPVVVFTTSTAPTDIAGSYQLHANAYVTKPTEFEDFSLVVRTINGFFTTTAKLPPPPAA
jgi:CheY-like chemotaxis protein